jgi:hypothetical protein
MTAPGPAAPAGAMPRTGDAEAPAGVASPKSPVPACSHCAAPLAGRYCHLCGQDSLPPETAWRSWVEQWRRLLRTLRVLLLEPGRLAQEHLGGSRVRFIPPFTLFLNAVAVFFLFAMATQFQLKSFVERDEQGWIRPTVAARAAAAGVPESVFIERAERRFQGVYTLSLALISLAGYTLVYKLFFPKVLPGLRGPFTLALNYLAFIFIFFLPWMMLAPRIAGYGTAMMFGSFAVTLAAAVAWNAVAARRIGGHGWPVALLKGLAIVVLGTVIDNLMFWVAIQSTLYLA